MVRQRRRRVIRRRRRTPIMSILKEQIIVSLAASTTFSLTVNNLSVDSRGIRPRFIKITFSTFKLSTQTNTEPIPSVIQVRFYNNIGYQITCHGPFMCGATTTRTVRLRFPQTGWFNPSSQNVIFALDNLCYSKTGKATTCIAIDFAYQCSLNIQPSHCPVTITEETTSESRILPTNEFNQLIQQQYLRNQLCTPGTSNNLRCQRLQMMNTNDPLGHVILPPVGVHRVDFSSPPSSDYAMLDSPTGSPSIAQPTPGDPSESAMPCDD